MNVNVICDDGYCQVFSIAANTTCDQLIEKLCSVRAALKLFTVKPNECFLRTIDSDSVFLVGSALISKHVAIGVEVFDISAIGFKKKVFEITQLYESTQFRGEYLQLSNGNSCSTDINTSPFDAIFHRSDQFFDEIENLLLQANQNNQGDIEINRVLKLATGSNQ